LFLQLLMTCTNSLSLLLSHGSLTLPFNTLSQKSSI